MVIKSNKYDTDNINGRILKLWKAKETTADEKVPLLYPELRKSCMLFVGLNPSFSVKGFRKILGDEFSEEKIEALYSWDNWDNSKIGEVLKYEKIAKGEGSDQDCYSYFGKFKEIADHAKLNWEHVDLFFDRNTSQNDVREKIFDKNESKFYDDQLNISFSLIDELSPKVIVVANALASDIINNRYEGSIKRVQDKGYHTIKLNSGNVPIFFSSMFTGMRALDKYSYDRLKWHIGYVMQSDFEG